MCNPNGVVRKYFPLDKNYLLEQAQLQQRTSLLRELMQIVSEAYYARYNPLRLTDGISQLIEKFVLTDEEPLAEFYSALAAVYRYKFSNNQLEFLWEGTDHLEKYKADWVAAFREWSQLFCREELFIRALLDVTVFRQPSVSSPFSANRLNHFMARHFDVRLHPQRGILPARMA